MTISDSFRMALELQFMLSATFLRDFAFRRSQSQCWEIAVQSNLSPADLPGERFYLRHVIAKLFVKQDI